jgi:hypothetical protein
MNQNSRIMFYHLLHNYLVARSEVNQLDLQLNQIDIENLFVAGFRNFNGVEVNEMCFPCYDLNEPLTHRGMLNAFICYYLLKNFTPKK